MRIAICDNDPRDLEHLAALLSNYQTKHGLEYKMFQTGIDLLHGVRGGEYDAVFLEILIPGFSGIQTARDLRKLDKNVKILFLTNSPKFAVESYSVEAYQYLLKPAEAKTLFPVLDKMESEIQHPEEEGLLLTGREGVTQIPFARLEYVEVMNKTVSFHLIDGSVRERPAALSDFEGDLLAHANFVKVHRSCLVNMCHVQSVSMNGAITRVGHILPIARTQYTQVKDAYMQFLLQTELEAKPEKPQAPPEKRETAHPWHILLVDDEPEMRNLWAEHLRSHGCVVDTAENKEEALQLATKVPYDCVVLDVMLAGESGFELYEQLHKLTDAPVIFLSCLTDAESQLKGFSVGGVDYITKNTPAELFWAKVETRIKLSRSERTQLRFGAMLLDLTQRKILLDEQVVILTPTEFDLLWLLADHTPRVYTPEELYHAVWGAQPWDGGQTVQVHMSRLRRKLEKAYSDHSFIETIWGQGYRFVSLKTV